MYKSVLNMFCQRKHWDLPTYSSFALDDASLYGSTVDVNGKKYMSEAGHMKKVDAEESAAKQAFRDLKLEHPETSEEVELRISKSMLQEIAVRKRLRPPVYEITSHGLPHRRMFACTVEFNGQQYTSELASTKKHAEMMACMHAIKEVLD